MGAALDWDEETCPESFSGLEPAARRMALAVYTAPDWIPRLVPLSHGANDLGRSHAATVCLQDTKVSRRHAVIHVGERILVEDCGSSNGTKLNGERLRTGQRVLLEPNDVLRVGGAFVIPVLEIDAQNQAVARTEFAFSGIDEATFSRFAASDLNVLIQGETGAGKDHMARLLHNRSGRTEGPLLAINCAALPVALAEATLFGYARGAFTGAEAASIGVLRGANRGTLLLDEVIDLPAAVQGKLLRAIEEHEVTPLGATKAIPVDIRFIALSQQSLGDEAALGRFRVDLLCRLNHLTVKILPLRARKAAIPRLAQELIRQSCNSGESAPELSPNAMEQLLLHTWPGNIRELHNVLRRTLSAGAGGITSIQPDSIPALGNRRGRTPLAAAVGSSLSPSPAGRSAASSRVEREKAAILEALASCGGNQSRAAGLLGISRRTLASRLDAYGIRRPRRREALP